MGDNDIFLLTTPLQVRAIYAKCNALERLELWEALQAIADNFRLSWIVEGVQLHSLKREKLGRLSFSTMES